MLQITISQDLIFNKGVIWSCLTLALLFALSKGLCYTFALVSPPTISSTVSLCLPPPLLSVCVTPPFSLPFLPVFASICIPSFLPSLPLSTSFREVARTPV